MNTDIELHEIAPTDLPDDASKVTVCVQEHHGRIRADVFCAHANRESAREYIVGLIMAIRRSEVAQGKRSFGLR